MLLVFSIQITSQVLSQEYLDYKINTKLNEGVYINFTDFVFNSPTVPGKIEDPRGQDFINSYWFIDGINTIYIKAFNFTTQKMEKYNCTNAWGYCSENRVYVFVPKGIYMIHKIEPISEITAHRIRYNGFNRQFRSFLVDLKTGKSYNPNKTRDLRKLCIESLSMTKAESKSHNWKEIEMLIKKYNIQNKADIIVKNSITIPVIENSTGIIEEESDENVIHEIKR